MNNFAVSSDGIATALKDSASSLVAANNSYEEAVSLIAAANRVVQDPASVGSALRTISLRVRGTSIEELEEQGEDTTGAVESSSKLRSKVLGLTGVDILTESGDYKSTYEIISDIADVWEQMGDVDQAALLELLAGKNRSNTLAALLSNAEDLEEAYKSAMNSEGSAMEENAKYMDSIQGRIDQFNNALQSMWSDTLDSDLVKGFVNLGTEIIKIIDKIGLLNSALLAIGAYKGVGAIFSIFKESGLSVTELLKRLGKYVGVLQSTTVAEKVFTQVQLQKKLQQQGLNAETAKAIIAETSLGVSTDKLSRETLEAALATQGFSAAQAKATADKIFGISVTNASTGALLKETIQRKLQNSALVQYAVKHGLVTAAQVSTMTTTQLLGLSFKALGKAIWGATKAIITFLFTNPAGWAILAVAAIASLIAIIFAVTKSTKELREELSDIKSELSDVRSEIESLNDELKTTEERIAELLAKDSLTFTEQEELENLKKQNAELERQIYLAELREKALNREAENTFDKIFKKEVGNDGKDQDIEAGIINYEFYLKNVEKQEAVLDDMIAGGASDFWIKEQEKVLVAAREQATKEYDKLYETLGPLLEDAAVVDYDSADATTKANIDYLRNAESRIAIVGGDEQANSMAIKDVFNKEKYAEVKNEIDNLVGELKKNPGDETLITKITDQVNKATEDLEAAGTSAEAAISYFTELGTNASFDTIDGKVAEIAIANEKLKSALTNSADFASLFDKNGKASEIAIAEYFKGTSEATRQEVSRLIQQIRDKKLSVDDALKQFEYFGIESTLDIYIKDVQTNFKDVFVELDDADGLIDTFQELGEAIGSTADALKTFNKAQAEMAYSGRVSIETALQLMEYTDDYGSILQVVDGKLQLVDGAEDALIQTRIEAIRTSAEASLSDATNAYNKAVLARQSYESALTEDLSAQVVAKSWEKVLAAGAGLWEGIKSLITDESWTDAYNRGYNATLSQITGYETEYTDAGMQALVDAENEAKKLMDAASDRVNLANQLTSATLESINDADDVDSLDDVKEKRADEAQEAFQNAMEYWENCIAASQARVEQAQNEVDRLESQGKKAGAAYYQTMMNEQLHQQELLNGQRDEALKRLRELEAAGEEGSENWWEVANILDDIDSSLDDINVQIQDYKDAMADVHWYGFEEVNTRVSNLADQLQNVRDILSNEDMFDDNGDWTKEGVASLGSLVQELGLYESALSEVAKERELFGDSYDPNKIYKDLDGNDLSIDSEQDWYDAVQKVNEEYDNLNNNIIDTKYAIKDMYESQVDAIEEAMQDQIDAYNDYIEVVQEAYDAERDLYNFKKDIQKQSKNIAETERRIASLSGSTNAADIAERRKLEAQLVEQKEGINDTYYNRANDQRSEALSQEAQAFEDSANRYVEGLRNKLDASFEDWYLHNSQMSETAQSTLNGITNAVMLNAGDISKTYTDTGAVIDTTLMEPWENATKAMGDFEDGLEAMNGWTADGDKNAPFYKFSSEVTNLLTKPWGDAKNVADGFKTSVGGIMDSITSSIKTNVDNSVGELNRLLTEMKETTDTDIRVNTSGGGGDSGGGSSAGGGSSGGGSKSNANVAALQTHLNNYFNAGLSVDGIMGASTTNAIKKMQRTIGVVADGSYGAATVKALSNYYQGHINNLRSMGNDYNTRSTIERYQNAKKTIPATLYAKGTLGTKKDEFAITDEPWIGDELTMYATPQGTLSFMRAGSTVVPADLTKELMAIGEIGLDGLTNMPKFNSGVNIMSNAINKPEIKIDVAEFVHVDTVDQSTMPLLEKMVDKKIDAFTRQLNYGLKGKGAR